MFWGPSVPIRIRFVCSRVMTTSKHACMHACSKQRKVTRAINFTSSLERCFLITGQLLLPNIFLACVRATAVHLPLATTTTTSNKNDLKMPLGLIETVRTALRYRGGWKGLFNHMYTVRYQKIIIIELL